MKRKDIEQLATATADELRSRLDDMRKRLHSLMFERSVGKLKNLHEIHGLRKDIARALTFLAMKHD